MHLKVRTTCVIVGMVSLLAACGGTASPNPSTPISSAAPSKPAASSAALTSSPPAGSAASAKPAGAPASAKPTVAPAAAGQSLVAYSEIVGSNAGLWGAKQADLFQKNGADVDLRLIESSLSVGALLSGQVQMAAVGGSESLAAAVQGADLRAIATLGPVYPYKFEVPASIQAKDDLKGKKVGVSRIGSSSDVATRVGLRKYGLDPNSDVSIVQVGSASARTAAMISGALQGALVTPPDTVKLESQGFHPLFDMAALKLPAANDMLVVQGSWLTGHRDVAQKIVDAEIQATAREKKDKTFAEDVLKTYYKVDDTKLLDAAYDYFITQTNPSLPYPTAEQVQDAVASVANKIPEAKSFDLSKFLDPSLVQNAASRGIDKTG